MYDIGRHNGLRDAIEPNTACPSMVSAKSIRIVTQSVIASTGCILLDRSIKISECLRKALASSCR